MTFSVKDATINEKQQLFFRLQKIELPTSFCDKHKTFPSPKASSLKTLPFTSFFHGLV